RGTGFPRQAGPAVDMGAFERLLASTSQGITAPPPTILPLLPPLPSSAVLGSQRRRGTTRLVARVAFTEGGPTRVVVSPFQQPNYQSVKAALRDLNGDGVF